LSVLAQSKNSENFQDVMKSQIFIENISIISLFHQNKERAF
jgi:hypothetical protein